MVAHLDPKSLIETLEIALEKAKKGEIVEAIVFGRSKDKKLWVCASGSYSSQEAAGQLLDAAIFRLGYELRSE